MSAEYHFRHVHLSKRRSPVNILCSTKTLDWQQVPFKIVFFDSIVGPSLVPDLNILGKTIYQLEYPSFPSKAHETTHIDKSCCHIQSSANGERTSQLFGSYHFPF
jgi:hypothetical protein